MSRKDILYSQNFLKSSALVTKLLDNVGIDSNDIVYEIGPGKGIITRELAKRCKKVIAIEKDEKLYLELVEKFEEKNNVEILFGDFLLQDFNFKKTKVFSNIPFNITTEIIKKIVNSKIPPKEIFLFVQKEAFERLTGQPKNTLFSLLIYPWFSLNIVYQFMKTDFIPIPNVNVVLLSIIQREKAFICKENAKIYKDFVSFAFNQKEGNIKNALKKIFTYKQIVKLSQNLDFKLDDKRVELSHGQWLGLFNYFLSGVTPEKRKIVLNSQKKLYQQQKDLEKIHRSRTSKDWKQKKSPRNNSRA